MKIYETWHCRKLSTIQRDEISWTNSTKFHEKRKKKIKSSKKFLNTPISANVKFPKLHVEKHVADCKFHEKPKRKKSENELKKNQEEFVPSIELKTSSQPRNDGD